MCHCYIRVTRLVRRYPEPLQLSENVKDEAAASDGAAGKNRLRITHLDSALFLDSERRDAASFMKAAAVHTMKSTKKGKQVALFNCRLIFFYAAALPDEGENVQKKVVPVSESRVEKFLSAQVLRTRISSLSVHALLFRTLRRIIHDHADKEGPLTTDTKGRSRRLVGVVSTHILPQQNMLIMRKKTQKFSVNESDRLLPLENTSADRTCTPRLRAGACHSFAQIKT